MTRRILAGFLAVLAVVLAAVVVPLGLAIADLERRDFRASARGAARSIAAVEEERLGDREGIAGAPAALRRVLTSGDGAVLLDHGRVVATAGPPVPGFVIDAVRVGRPPGSAGGDVVVVATVGDPRAPIGNVVLLRSAGPLADRERALWLGLAAAALVAVVAGALIAVGLARWIGRPLHALQSVVSDLDASGATHPAEEHSGPPEVRRLAGAFNAMAARLASLVAAQRGMTADVSHQLRTPLSALRLRLELLAEDASGPIRAELGAVLEEIGRLSRLVDGLLAVARSEAIVAPGEPVDLAALAGDRVAAWRPVADDRGVDLDLEAVPATGWSTPGHVEQILDNLIANALEAVAPGGRVVVTVGADHEGPRVAVVDDGPGLTAAQRQRAFGRFASDRAGGTGLGLAIVGRLVAADGGTATLEETPGGGLTAAVLLPGADGHRAPGH